MRNKREIGDYIRQHRDNNIVKNNIVKNEEEYEDNNNIEKMIVSNQIVFFYTVHVTSTCLPTQCSVLYPLIIL